jgi:glycosyltransferase involved in cell wall biosynthesis
MALFLGLTARSEFQHWTFLVVGTGELSSREPSVRFLGPITDLRLMAAAFSAADVFVTAALEDNYPSTVAESQLCGTPVVGLAVGGQKEMVDQGIAGWLSGDISVNGLVEGLKWYESSQPDRNRIAEAAHKRWNESRVVGQWLEFYRSLS